MNTDQTSIYKSLVHSIIIEITVNLASTLLLTAGTQIMQAIGWC